MMCGIMHVLFKDHRTIFPDLRSDFLRKRLDAYPLKILNVIGLNVSVQKLNVHRNNVDANVKRASQKLNIC